MFGASGVKLKLRLHQKKLRVSILGLASRTKSLTASAFISDSHDIHPYALMQDDTQPLYPIRATSKSLPLTRTNKLRFSWFIIGLIAGSAITFFTLSLSQSSIFIEPTTVETADTTSDSAPAPETQEQAEESEAQALATPEKPPEPQETVYPLTITASVESGDTLISILIDAGASSDEANNLLQAIKKKYDPKKLSVGQNITIELDKDPQATDKLIINNMVLPISATSSLELLRKSDGTFDVKKTQAPITRKLRRASGKIDGSLYETGLAKGLTPSLLSELIAAYSYDVDFQRDIKRGDTMDILYERMETDEGVLAGYGHIVYANLKLGKRSVKIYRYVDKKGNADFYNSKGENVRKALLRTPVNGLKITSGFGMRNHPILGYSRMHRGVDFGAPTGTPIYAAGDGVIAFAGNKGAYGNYVQIKHTKAYATAYAHVSRFAKGIATGKKVKQGQIIAYVGTTGMSTGPHLHYEVLQNGKQINPSGVKFKTGTVLGGKELANFKKFIGDIEKQVVAEEKKPVKVAVSSDAKLSKP